jgi:hypothetical protein
MQNIQNKSICVKNTHANIYMQKKEKMQGIPK